MSVCLPDNLPDNLLVYKNLIKPKKTNLVFSKPKKTKPSFSNRSRINNSININNNSVYKPSYSTHIVRACSRESSMRVFYKYFSISIHFVSILLYALIAFPRIFINTLTSCYPFKSTFCQHLLTKCLLISTYKKKRGAYHD